MTDRHTEAPVAYARPSGTPPELPTWMEYAAGAPSGFVRTPETFPRRRRARLVVLPVLGAVALLVLGVLAQRAVVLGRNPAAAGSIDPAASLGSIATAPALPPGTSRFVPTAPRRLLDGTAQEPDGTLSARLPGALGRVTAAVVSVSVQDSASAGEVTVFGAAPEPAAQLTVPGRAAATLALVVVPLDHTRTVQVRSTAGGDLAADLVGVFAPVSASTTAGRTIVITPQRLAHRVTAQVGHEGLVDALAPAAIPDRGVGAVLVRVTGDFGRRGGTLRLGPTPQLLGPVLRWSTPAPGDKTRTAVAFVPLGPDGRFAVSYHGGFVLDVDALAFVTDRTAAASTQGLFVPAPRTGVLSASVTGGTQAHVDLGTGVRNAAAALVTVTASGTERSQVVVGEPRRPARPVVVSPGGGVARSALVPVLSAGPLAVGTERDTTVRVDLVGAYLSR